MAAVPSRRILALAFPALGALAAEPLYLLVDTAVVGRLGAEALAGLAVGGVILANSVWLMSFLAYGTTGIAARLFGAGRREDAVRAGVQATWLALGLGIAVGILLQVFAEPLVAVVAGGNEATREAAVGWLRIAALGSPFITITLAGQGWLRGIQDLRRPLVYLLIGNAISAALAPILVHIAGLGLEGSAVANVVGQIVGATLFILAIVRERVSLRPNRLGIRTQLAPARDLGLRTIALQAVFVSATSLASRLGPDQVAAHLIVIQLWFFLALVLDALAIAGQALIGDLLGAGRVDAARATARRLALYGLGCGAAASAILLAGWNVVPRIFTPDQAVIDSVRAVWPWFLAMEPLAGLLFALDGVLIGAGDNAFMRNASVAGAVIGYLPLAGLTVLYDLGLPGLWAALTAFIVVRCALVVVRTERGRWAVTGAVR